MLDPAKPGGRRDVDDRTRALLQHDRADVAAAVPDPEQVDADRLLEELVGQLLGHRPGVAGRARVADQDVQAAEALDRGARHLGHLLGIGDVAGDGQSPATARLNAAGELLQAVGPAGRHHHVRAGVGEGLGERDAQPGRRPCHDRRSAAQVPQVTDHRRPPMALSLVGEETCAEPEA